MEFIAAKTIDGREAWINPARIEAVEEYPSSNPTTKLQFKSGHHIVVQGEVKDWRDAIARRLVVHED